MIAPPAADRSVAARSADATIVVAGGGSGSAIGSLELPSPGSLTALFGS